MPLTSELPCEGGQFLDDLTHVGLGRDGDGGHYVVALRFSSMVMCIRSSLATRVQELGHEWTSASKDPTDSMSILQES